MAKQSGLGWTTLTIDSSAGSPEAIKNDITNFNFTTPRGVQEVTGVDKFAYERILLLADFTIQLNGPANFAASPSSHDVFKTIPSSSVARTTTLVISSQTLAPEVLYTDYNFTRANTGELTFQVPGVLADGTVPTWS